MFHSRALAIYAVAVGLECHLRVVFGEEPWLARTFGARWLRYKAQVPRWFEFRHLAWPRRHDVVHDTERDVSPAQPAAEVANLGLIRPPLVYLGSIGLGLLVHTLWPVQLLPASISMPLGVILVLVAAALFISAVRTLRKAGTPVPGNRPTTIIVRTGPYVFSRNPIYLAFTLFQIGLAAWVNSLGLLVTVLPALALMVLVVVPREERYLEARFPSQYPAFKREVRRWL
jgi:protein-S-isoprenylcysteine O-methyltransferase Ste14